MGLSGFNLGSWKSGLMAHPCCKRGPFLDNIAPMVRHANDWLQINYSTSRTPPSSHPSKEATAFFCQICTSVDDLTNLCNQATPLIRLLYLSLSLEGFYCIYKTFYKSSLFLQHENNTSSIQNVWFHVTSL